MSVDDRHINIRVEQVLVRRGINTQRLTVSTHRANVIITGTLEGRSKKEEIKTAADMKALEKTIRRVPNVRDVQWHLANWHREEGNWRRVQPAAGPPAS